MKQLKLELTFDLRISFILISLGFNYKLFFEPKNIDASSHNNQVALKYEVHSISFQTFLYRHLKLS